MPAEPKMMPNSEVFLVNKLMNRTRPLPKLEIKGTPTQIEKSTG